ncbi:MAG: hypothetical protein OXH65_05905 [Paracoccaceae bacterium]|nr:hypothetical protein [Paracoccaceae bacterium]MDE2674627.1 hypothetical protein [Paracoccaceae bacterium]
MDKSGHFLAAIEILVKESINDLKDTKYDWLINPANMMGCQRWCFMQF